jgi:hypothetical protein
MVGPRGGGPQGFRLLGRSLTTEANAVTVRRSLSQEVMVPPATTYELEDGDVVWSGADGWAIDLAPSVRDDALEQRAVSAWNDTAHWGVLADRLLDHGDPLGASISQALGRRSTHPLSPHTWVGVEWQHGVLRRAAFGRPEWTHTANWREAVLEVLMARQARFLEEVSIDLPRLDAADPGSLRDTASTLLGLPWPRWLQRLHLGASATLSMLAPEALHQTAPRLERAPLFRAGDTGRLIVESVSDGLVIDGIPGDALPIAEGLRVRVLPGRVVVERPSWPRYDSWPSWDFGFHDGRWFLAWRHGAPRSDEIRINGMEFFNACLVHGDRIQISEQLVLRVEFT